MVPKIWTSEVCLSDFDFAQRYTKQCQADRQNGTWSCKLTNYDHCFSHDTILNFEKWCDIYRPKRRVDSPMCAPRVEFVDLPITREADSRRLGGFPRKKTVACP
jgi:hypothetical protein